ncbi:MAG TPA: hypothetical protein VLE46_03950 [Nitrospira sp.]|nr:hypothetical protein [Nitrospira sp.]
MHRLIHHPNASLLYEAITEEKELKNTTKNASPVTSSSYQRVAPTILRKCKSKGALPDIMTVMPKKHAKPASTGKHKGKSFKKRLYPKQANKLLPPDTSRIPWMSEFPTPKTGTDD